MAREAETAGSEGRRRPRIARHAAAGALLSGLLAMARSSPLPGALAILAWYYAAAGVALAAGGTLGGLLAAGWVRSP
jgi:hypothetical protein